ncbi:MAG TPA: hypothetical protein VHG89_06750 [Verrucomicrobiae bacterium]|nr:hypothetical protein [Verrucomicrobiae bacterium]
MADIPPITPGMPAGAVPPKKETGKVQPKKETVRINLPPKPSAAPTIKLPTLPPGGPTGAPSAMPAPVAAAPAAPRAAAPVAQSRPAPVVQRAAPVSAPTISPLDKILVFAAAIAGLFAVGSVLYLWLGISIGE